MTKKTRYNSAVDQAGRYNSAIDQTGRFKVWFTVSKPGTFALNCKRSGTKLSFTSLSTGGCK